MNFPVRGAALLVLAPLLSTAVFARPRTQSRKPSQLPKAASSLMQIAARQNGLDREKMEPWHVHAAWQISASKRAPAMQGTFDEWWTGPHQYKAVYLGPDFHQTLTVTPDGSATTGNAQWPDLVLRLIEPLVRSPLPPPAQLRSTQFANWRTRAKKVRIRCAIVVPGTEPRPPLERVNLWFVSDYCFAGTLPAIRMELAPNFKAIFNSIVLFQGQYFAKSIQVLRKGLPTLSIHVDDIQTIPGRAAGRGK